MFDLGSYHHARRCYGYTAAKAFKFAREQHAAGKRMLGKSISSKADRQVSWQPEKGMAFIECPEEVGLRLVGRVQADGKSGRVWDSNDSSGWYDNDEGESFRDGTGLIYGLVYQLPARDGKARFVAAWRSGSDYSPGVTVDLSTILEEDCRDGYGMSASEWPAAHDAARNADSMARREAEREKDYRRDYAAGGTARAALEEVNLMGKYWTAEFRKLRTAFCERWQAVRDDVPISATREWLRMQVQDCRDMRDAYKKARKEAFKQIDDLRPGRYDKTGRDAFNAGYFDGLM